jgi:hypothetical protein
MNPISEKKTTKRAFRLGWIIGISMAVEKRPAIEKEGPFQKTTQ